MSGVSRLLAIGMLLALAGCASMEAYGVFGDEREVFTGHMVEAGNGRGRIDLDNGKGTKCLGEYSGNVQSAGLTALDVLGAKPGSLSTSAGTGRALMTCSDGEQALVQFTSVGTGRGYGFGTTRTGWPVRFVFGMARDQGAQYLAIAPNQAAGGGGPQSPSRKASGTGFFVTRQGHFVTNAHVVNGCNSVTATPLGGSAMAASVVNIDKTNDLAVLKTAGSPSTIAALRAGRPIRQGESVVAYGFPLTGALSSGGVTTNGTVSALTGLHDDSRFLQFSAPAQPGNSGGPLVDMSGAVVGVVTSGLDPQRGVTPQNVNFAVKAEVVRTFLAAVGVGAETSSGGRELATPDVVDKTRAFTVFVECNR